MPKNKTDRTVKSFSSIMSSFGLSLRKIPQKIVTSFKLWYSYSKQTIPTIFILIGTIFITAFLDFNVQGTEVMLESHISAMRKLLNTEFGNMSSLFLFVAYLIAIVQVFNSSNFAKKRSPVGLFLLTGLTIVQAVTVGLYTTVYYVEETIRPDYVIDSVARFSFTVLIIGSAFTIVGTIFAWFYVNWGYVKQVED